MKIKYLVFFAIIFPACGLFAMQNEPLSSSASTATTQTTQSEDFFKLGCMHKNYLLKQQYDQVKAIESFEIFIKNSQGKKGEKEILAHLYLSELFKNQNKYKEAIKILLALEKLTDTRQDYRIQEIFENLPQQEADDLASELFEELKE